VVPVIDDALDFFDATPLVKGSRILVAPESAVSLEWRGPRTLEHVWSQHGSAIPVIRFNLPREALAVLEGPSNVAFSLPLVLLRNKWTFPSRKKERLLLSSAVSLCNKLKSSDDERRNALILAFARRWGPLWFDELNPPYLDATGRLQSLGYPALEPGEEPVSTYINTVGEAVAMLRIGSRLSKSQTADAADWRSVCVLDPPEELELQRHLFTNKLTRSINFRNQMLLVPHYFPESKLRVSPILPIGFAPLLWLSILAVLAHGVSFSVCSECLSPYIRTEGRGAKSGQNNFCPECREMGYRLSQRLSRERKKAKCGNRLISASPEDSDHPSPQPHPESCEDGAPSE
jgi:hypothetical protein